MTFLFFQSKRTWTLTPLEFSSCLLSDQTVQKPTVFLSSRVQDHIPQVSRFVRRESESSQTDKISNEIPEIECDVNLGLNKTKVLAVSASQSRSKLQICTLLVVQTQQAFRLRDLMFTVCAPTQYFHTETPAFSTVIVFWSS